MLGTTNENDSIIWEDTKRILGIPITFTKYKATQSKLICEKGMIHSTQDILQIYKIVDISMSISSFQKIFKVGTIEIHANDAAYNILLLENIKNPAEVMDKLNNQIEKARKIRTTRLTEIIGGRDIL